MKPFGYASAASVDEVLQRLTPNGHPAAVPLAGGTDLLTLLKADVLAPSELLDLKRARGIPSGISEDSSTGDLVLGALTTLAEIEHGPLVRERFTALAEAMSQAATPQLRNMATIGGNLLQRPRCWYFRNRHIDCWLKGGTECPARDGENALHAIFAGMPGVGPSAAGPSASDGSPCVAVHPSDPAAALTALDASVVVRGPRGERVLSMAQFYAPHSTLHRKEAALEDDEVVLEIRLPRPRDGSRSTYVKAMDRAVWAFALVGAAVSVTVRNERIEAASVVLSGVAPVPWRATAAEQVLEGASVRGSEQDVATDQHVDVDLVARAAVAAFAGAQPLSDNGYKVRLGQGLVRQALQAVLR